MSSLTQITLGQPPKEFWGQFVAICGWRVVLGLHQNSLTHSPPHNPPPQGLRWAAMKSHSIPRSAPRVCLELSKPPPGESAHHGTPCG